MSNPTIENTELERLRDWVMSHSNTTGYPHCEVYLEHPDDGDEPAFLNALHSFVSQEILSTLDKVNETCEYCHGTGMITVHDSGDKYADSQNEPCDEPIHEIVKAEKGKWL